MTFSSYLTNRPYRAWLPIFLLIGTGLLACNDAQTETPAETSSGAEDTKIDETLREQFRVTRELHDEFMPLRSEMVALERQLKESKLDTSLTAFAKTRLASADDAMMTWMYNDEPLTNLVGRLSPKLASQHLDIRAKEMRSIGDSMQVAIDYAKSIVQ